MTSTKQLDLTIALQPRDPEDLQALATEVSTPGTPQFRQFLSVPQFASRFGASQLQIDADESALRAQGLDVGTVTANDLTLPVTGTAAQVEKASRSPCPRSSWQAAGPPTPTRQLAGTSYLNNFTDVATASPFSGQANNDALYEFNIGNNPNHLFPLATGYDMATGLGSMIAPQLASSLCSAASPVYMVAVASPGAQRTTVGQGVSLPVHASDSGPAALSYAASGMPPGLSLNPATGLISGTVAAVGSYSVTVAAGDGFGNRGSTTFPWSVVAVPKQPATPKAKAKASKVALTGLAKGKPKLSFSIAAAKGGKALKGVSISLPRDSASPARPSR
jgi:hypothetical protein